MSLTFPWSLWAALLVRSLFHCSDHCYPEKEINVTYFPLISLSWSAGPFFISLLRQLLSRKRDECHLLSLDLSGLLCWSVLYVIVQTIVIKKKEINVTYFPLISLSCCAGPFSISLFRRLSSRKRDKCYLLSLDLSELLCWSVLYVIAQTIVIQKKKINVTYFPLISVSWSAGPSSSGQRWSWERQSEQCRPHIIPVLCCGMFEQPMRSRDNADQWQSSDHINQWKSSDQQTNGKGSVLQYKPMVM